MELEVVIDGRVFVIPLGPALTAEWAKNEGVQMTEEEVIAFVEEKRRARALKRAAPYLSASCP